MPQGAIPFPFGDCRICLDKATGVHYGVNTCEGCKGFFKRSIPKASKYKCFFGGMCQVNAQNRNRCKACRFQRCVQAGMSMDAVKMGRIPKVDKERALEAKAREDTVMKGEKMLQGFASVFQPYNKKPSENTDEPDIKPFIDSSGVAYPSSQNGDSSVKPRADEMSHVNSSPSKESHLSPQNQPRNDGKNNAMFLPRHQLPAYNTHQTTLSQHFSVPPNFPYNGIPSTGSNHSNSNQIGRFNHDKLMSIAHSGSQILPSSNANPLLFCSPEADDTNHHNNSFVSTTPPPPLTHYAPPSADLNQFSIPNLPSSSYQDQLSPHRSLPTWDDYHGKNRFAAYKPGCGSDSGVSADGSEPVQNSPKHIEDLGNPSPQKFANPAFHDNCALGNSVIKEENVGGTVRSYDNGYLDNDVIHSGSATPTNRGYNRSMSETHPSVRAFHSPQSVVAREDMSTSHSISPQSDRTSISHPTPPITPDPFSPNVIKELFSQLKVIRSHTPTVENRIQDLLQRVSKEEYQSVLMSILNEASKHMAKDYPSGSSSARSTPLVRRCESLDEYGPAAKRSRTVSLNDLDPSLSVGKAHVNRLQSIPHESSENILIKEENVTNDSLYGGGTGNTSQEAARPEVRATDESDDEGEHVSMIRSTLNKLAEAEREHFGRIRERERVARQVAEGVIKKHPLNEITQATYRQVTVVWKGLFHSVPAANQMIIGLCRDIPGFNNLDADNRTTLIKSAYFDVWMLAHARFFHDNDSDLPLLDCDNLLYSRFWMRHFLPAELVDKMLGFGQNVNDLNLNVVQMFLIAALQLTDSNCPDISQKSEVQLLNNHFLDVLEFSIRESHPTNHRRVLIQVFKLLPQLNEIKTLQSQVIGSFMAVNPPAQCESMVVPGSKEQYLREEAHKERVKQEEEAKTRQLQTPNQIQHQHSQLQEYTQKLSNQNNDNSSHGDVAMDTDKDTSVTMATHKHDNISMNDSLHNSSNKSVTDCSAHNNMAYSAEPHQRHSNVSVAMETSSVAIDASSVTISASTVAMDASNDVPMTSLPSLAPPTPMTSLNHVMESYEQGVPS